MKPTLFVLAAGMSSRYGQLKQLEALGPNGETLIDYAVYDAIAAGFGEVVFVIRPEIEEALKAFYEPRYSGKIKTGWVYQELDKLPAGLVPPAERKKPWGTAHAVLMAKDYIKTPFVVINCDDFYSAASYQMAADFFQQHTAPHCAVVGFQLGNTLSPNGSVARAVCQVSSSGELAGIQEYTKILKQGNDILAMDLPEFPVMLPAEAVVSMNFWALQPAVFPIFEAAFADYLKTELNNPGAEFFIATGINNAAAAGQLPVHVLSCPAPWFGITYPADKEMVQQQLAQLHQAGHYPSPLF